MGGGDFESHHTDMLDDNIYDRRCKLAEAQPAAWGGLKQHLPDYVRNPHKYRRYDIDWNESEVSNTEAAAATFDLLRKRKGDIEEERADLSQGVVFNQGRLQVTSEVRRSLKQQR